MLQFVGLSLTASEASIAFLARDFTLTHQRSTPVAGARAGDDGVTTVPPAEWARAATWLTRESWLDLPVPSRKLWGLALAGPSGWIALDSDYEPLDDLRLVPAARVAEDVRAWLDADTKRSRRVTAILSPKDWLRYRTSGALAGDVTLATRLGLTDERADAWSSDRVADAGLERAWLPPIFDCAVVTGRISPEGVDLTGLPGGPYLAAGALEHCAAGVAAADLREPGVIWAPRGRPWVTVSVAPDAEAPPPPDGFARVRSPYAGRWWYERARTEGESPEAAASATRAAIEAAGGTVAAIVHEDGDAAVGAAAIAAEASGKCRGLAGFYAARAKAAAASDEAAAAEEAAPATDEATDAEPPSV